MKCRQSEPRQWLIVDSLPEVALRRAVRRLSRGSGVLVIGRLGPGDMRRLRKLAGLRKLTIVAESPGTAARIHNARELTRALLHRPELVLISPLYPTHSHPDWKPLPPMRAAALARLAKRRAIALGGMNAERYPKIAQLGFIGWAGISAFRT